MLNMLNFPAESPIRDYHRKQIPKSAMKIVPVEFSKFYAIIERRIQIETSSEQPETSYITYETEKIDHRFHRTSKIVRYLPDGRKMINGAFEV